MEKTSCFFRYFHCLIKYEDLSFSVKRSVFRNMDQILQTGDTILVKASHGMKFPEIVDRLRKEETKS